MTTNLRNVSMSLIIALVISACNIGTSLPSPQEEAPQALPATTLGMTVNYEIVDQTIIFSYLVTNISSTPVPGPISITDNKVPATCPPVNTTGNTDDNLDPGETITCTGFYTITQADLDAGSVMTVATATASGHTSTAIPTTVPLPQNRALTLTKSADPTTYNNVGDSIIYTYNITNSGDVALGPVQFTVSDNKISFVINCGSGGAVLPPNETISCSATYLITQADVTAGSVTNSATATDGTTTSNTATTTINRGTTTTPSNLTPGSTIQHQVVNGEWLWQIARCYGASPK